MQARLTLNERLAFIATKDVYADASFDLLLSDGDGLADRAAGFKYNFVRDEDRMDWRVMVDMAIRF